MGIMFTNTHPATTLDEPLSAGDVTTLHHQEVNPVLLEHFILQTKEDFCTYTLLLQAYFMSVFIQSMTKARKREKIRNRYNQTPHLTQDTKLELRNYLFSSIKGTKLYAGVFNSTVRL